MKLQQIFAAAQLSLGVAMIGTLAWGYLNYRQPIRDALKQLDVLAASAESEIETAVDLLSDVRVIGSQVEGSLPLHRASLQSISGSMHLLAGDTERWRGEIPRLQAICEDAQLVATNFAAQLPLEIPFLEYETRHVEYQLPQFTPQTREIEIPYPTASVQTGTKTLSYPQGAEVEMKKWERSLGSFAGRDFGSLALEYPAGLSVRRGRISLDYPTGIEIKPSKMKVSVPDTPEVTTQDYSFDIPSNMQITRRPLLADEKVLLERSAEELGSLRGSLQQTDKTLAAMHRLLTGDLPTSLGESESLLRQAEQNVQRFNNETIPTVLADLQKQKTGIATSRDLFVRTRGVVELAFGLLGLLAAAVCCSAAAKMYGHAQP